MPILSFATLAMGLALGVSSAAAAQDIPDAPVPAEATTAPVIPTTPVATDAAAPVIPATPAAPAVVPAAPVAPPAAPPLAAYTEVEVEDPVDPGFWDRCTVIEAFQGAYEVSCNHTRTIRRDVHVRPVGGQPVTQTAARPAAGPPFGRGTIVLGSTMGLPNDWKLCVILRNEVEATNSYAANCGGGPIRLLPNWARADPKAPAS
ncbi:hypothetical protein KOAAANKH_03834 [Brevundimonas sp. NIBR10]|uniref:hypothetical protein n=1 Tax=Brevundimonas sp. NIBR10 TaxID=3015997 RepID=UPI0022F16C08|nr:hypothetical protein [Brevundimonas sp. NIBR10]WGM48920.1 hypothetical protein KOAAANKH_03834 [Brevundimonas sp. NIBR10]